MKKGPGSVFATVMKKFEPGPFFAAAALAVAANAAEAPRVNFFNPQNEAKSVRQVSVRFTEPMVAFGDPRVADPFDVKCQGDEERLKGRGRWADARNWIYDFEADLPAGQRCTFALKYDAKSLAGAAVEGKREFTFNTGGPAIMTAWPNEGDEGIDEEQVFVLALDAKPDPASLSDAWCQASGINERIPLKLLSEKETREILEANKNRAYDLFRAYFVDKSSRRMVPLAQFKIEDKRWRDLPVVAARCAQRLPNESEVKIVLGPGVKSATGIARGTEQALAFRVRKAFLVKLTCERVNKDAACLPVTPITLSFNAPVSRDLAADIRLKGEAKSYEPELEKNEKTVENVTFSGPFPEKARFTVELPRNFRDDAGREPSNKSSFPLQTGTDEAPPLAKFPARFGILELNADPVLPVTVRNIERIVKGQTAQVPPAVGAKSARIDDEAQIARRYADFIGRGYERRARKLVRPGEYEEIREGEVSALETNDRRTQGFELPRGGDKTFEVIGIPMKKPGFYIVELASPRLGRALHAQEKPYYVSTSVLVTNLAVHLKHGREGSLVWVTSLDRGKPVPNARVTVRDCGGRPIFEGTTDANGIADAADRLPARDDIPKCSSENYERMLFAFARVGEDVAFTASNWGEGINPWDFNLRTGTRRTAPVAIHTVFDRPLFRAGETVSMKHVARVATGTGFKFPAANALPTAAEIEHLGSGQKVALKVAFDDQGVAESTWTIPKEAKLGFYRIAWKSRNVESGAQFRVEAYRVPIMRATLAPPKEPMVKPAEVKLDAAVTYLAGGGAAHLPVKVRSRLEERGVSFRDFPEFAFGGRPVKEGIKTGSAEDLYSTFDADEEPAEATQQATPTSVRSLTLDASGTAKISIDKLPGIDRPSSLLAEMEYSDPNGELLAVATRVPLHTAALYVGIKPEGWAASKTAVRAQIVVVDTAGKPLAGRSVNVDVYERKTYSNRRRLVGGFYAYDSTVETKRIGNGCSGTTDERGLLFCTVKPRTIGEVILAARAKDDAGREAQANASVWVRGSDEWWFEPVNHDRIDLIPEKKRYEPGETAKFQVRMPFREATVLVTVEREGVLSSKVVQLDAKSPVIEVPVIGSYGPNVFVSALALRGRVDPEVPGPYAWLKTLFYRVAHWLGLVDDVPVERDTRPTALVDLSRPAYKLGMAEIKVGRRDYALNVKVTPDREVFKVRETARVNVEVADMSGKPAANGEIALAAVDEGLLELMDNASWNILEAILGERPVEVFTSTAQGQVVGKRHFGKKAVTHGGGGGRAGARELFETLLLWKGRVPLDAQGRASIAVPLNDSLTSFRIVAVATSGAAKFGDGKSSIRTTQDLMLFSGLPPVVREQDDFAAMFTLRNTTAQPLTAKLDWAVRDKQGDGAKTIAQGDQSVSLAASEAKVISLPLKAPVGVERLYWDVAASRNPGPAERDPGGAGDARDRLRVTQLVKEVHPVRVYQATLAQLDKPLEFQVERPADAVPGRGGVRVDVMGTIGGDLTAVREYFLRYPYVCLEQRASKAIGLGDNALWNAVAASLPNYLDRDGLARYFPIGQLEGSDALTAYLVQIADAAGREWPDEERSRMLKGLEAFATGRIVRGSALTTADLTIRKLAAIEALARHDRAKAAMLEPLSIDPALWPTSALIDWIGILKRVKDVPKRPERLQEALGLLRGRLNFQGTVMTFSTERNDALWWLMVSGDVNANRGLLAVLDQPDWREDVGRLVRGTLSRQKRGTWNTTVANAWGTVALGQFAKAFEKTAASGTTLVAVGAQSLAVPVTRAAQTRDFEWPAAREPLSVVHKGAGAPWAIVQSRAAIPLRAPLFTGYSIKRSVAPVEQKDKSAWSRGDVYRVTLEIDAQSDMTWVVVDDPIPAGAQILGSGLGRDAGSLTQGEKRAGWTTPAFIERTQEAYRAYYQFVPKGKFSLEYTVRLNNPGRFDLPATRVEALYAPEMFGELPNQSVAVK